MGQIYKRNNYLSLVRFLKILLEIYGFDDFVYNYMSL